MQNTATLAEAARDYEVVRQNLDYLREHWREQPSLDLLAERNGLSAAHLQRLFMRWARLSPKAFVQALTIDHARKLLRDSASVLDASYEVGLSGPGRLHDLFVTHEGMTPGAYKARGKGLTIRYGYHPCPFGKVLLMMTEQGICGLAFADEGQEETSFQDMRSRWPEADFVEDAAATAGPVCVSKMSRTGSALAPMANGRTSRRGLPAAIVSQTSSICAPNTLSPPAPKW